MRIKYNYLLLIIVVMMCGSNLVWATQVENAKVEQTVVSDMDIISSSTVEDQVYLFVKAKDTSLKQLSCQIGTTLCKDIKLEPINELDVAMKTLVMVDNSLSILPKNRTKTKELLLEYIAEKKDNELVRIATFNDKITYLTDYTSEYTTLKKAIQSITYNDQITYLTDVLYSVLESDFETDEAVYNRIIIISDGVDNKAVGYTKEELYLKVNESAIPIYCFGCSDGSNNEALKNMFAISRASKASHYLVGQIQNVDIPVSEMAEDRQVIRIQVNPEVDLLDGTTKKAMLTVAQGDAECTAMTDVKMPFKVKEEQSPSPEVVPVVETIIEEEPVSEEKDYTLILSIAAGLLCVIILIIIILLIMQKKKQNAFETITEEALVEDEEEEIEEPTVTEADELTCRIWDEPMRKSLVLTDINMPSKTFQVPLIDSVIIGRSQKQSTLVIDYDKSVSGKHCEILLTSRNKVLIIDLNSSNGTYVNGNRVITETEIASGAIVKLGRLEFKVEIR